MAPCGPSKRHKLQIMKEMLVGAVGIEPKALLTGRKLLIRLKAKNAKYTGIAQLRYTPGTRGLAKDNGMTKYCWHGNFGIWKPEM